jgi:hypothetical protein
MKEKEKRGQKGKKQKGPPEVYPCATPGYIPVEYY